MFNFVYETPCSGKITGLMRLSVEGFPEMCPLENLGGQSSGPHPDVPTHGWLPLYDLGSYETPEEMANVMNQRKGWSLVERDSEGP